MHRIFVHRQELGPNLAVSQQDVLDLEGILVQDRLHQSSTMLIGCSAEMVMQMGNCCPMTGSKVEDCRARRGNNIEGSIRVRRRPAPSFDRFGSHRRCSTPRNFRNDSPRTATPGFAFIVHRFLPSIKTESERGRIRRFFPICSPHRRGGLENSFRIASTLAST